MKAPKPVSHNLTEPEPENHKMQESCTPQSTRKGTRKMKTFRIKVKAPSPTRPGQFNWVYGRPSSFRHPYQFATRMEAEDAARLWGDAYDLGDVKVVEEDFWNQSKGNHL